MSANWTRREMLCKSAAGLAGAYLLGPSLSRAVTAPAARVTVARCKTYDPAELLPRLAKMFDELGGLERLVKGKTVAMKVNFTGGPTARLGYLPLEYTHFTHPNVITGTVHLMGKAGAKRVRVLESGNADPLDEFLLQANWDPNEILHAASNVEFENTINLGRGKKYARFNVPYGGYLFPAYDLNHSYEDCDVFVSVAKLKEHATTGITLSMKNCFGITPTTIYGDGAGTDEPSEVPRGGRGLIHYGNRQPCKSAPSEKDPKSPRDAGYRVPRAVVDLVAARPIDLAIVEGVTSMTGGEGPWVSGTAPTTPGVLVAGTNAVSTDAVCMAVMGFDPMAERGTPPFEKCDSTLHLAENVGIGARDLKRIEVLGTPIQQAMLVNFAAIRRQRTHAHVPTAGHLG
jgi:uncharacterized protein (DUF362 family)